MKDKTKDLIYKSYNSPKYICLGLNQAKYARGANLPPPPPRIGLRQFYANNNNLLSFVLDMLHFKVLVTKSGHLSDKILISSHFNILI